MLRSAVNVVGLTFAVLLDYNFRWEMKIHPIAILLSASFSFLLLLFIDYNRKNPFTYLAIFSVVICILVIVSISQKGVIRYFNQLKRWYDSYQIEAGDYRIGHALVILVLFIIGISIFFYLINKHAIPRYITAIGLLIWLLYAAIVGINVNKVTVCIILIYLLEILVEIVNNIYNKKGIANHFAINIYILPLCILVGGLASIIPSKDKPIQWYVIKHLISSVSDKWENMTYGFGILSGKNSGDFTVNFTGYTDEEVELGGKVNRKNEVILKVSPREKANGSTYFIGNVRDEYTLKGWKKSKINYYSKQELKIDFYQMLYSMYLNNMQSKENESLFHQMRVTLDYQNIKTKNLFYPIKSYQLEIPSGYDYNSDTPTLQTKRLLKKDFSYQINFMEVNYNSETLVSYLRNASRTEEIQTINRKNQVYDRDKCITYLKNLLALQYYDETILNDKLDELLDKRQKEIHKYYTAVPKEIPNRVYELAEMITKRYDNNYDKLKAIEAYLSSFQYTLTPSKTKKGEDFVDYFLFEQKEGYCTYFASSMAILGRCIGIPTRYVEGVIADYKEDKTGKYLIDSNASHAWVEAYIDSVGWIPFEPTPGKYVSRYGDWADKKIIPGKSVNPLTPPLKQSYVPSDYEVQKQQKTQISKERMEHYQYMLHFCIAIIVIIFILGTFAILGLNFSKKKHYLHASKEEQIKYLICEIIKDLEEEGYELNFGETLLEYIKRIKVDYEFTDDLEEVCLIYMKLRYASKEITEVEIKKIVVYHNQLKDYIRNKMGLLKRIRYGIRVLLRPGI